MSKAILTDDEIGEIIEAWRQSTDDLRRLAMAAGACAVWKERRRIMRGIADSLDGLADGSVSTCDWIIGLGGIVNKSIENMIDEAGLEDAVRNNGPDGG
jgi:hypothetical protein